MVLCSLCCVSLARVIFGASYTDAVLTHRLDIPVQQSESRGRQTIHDAMMSGGTNTFPCGHCIHISRKGYTEGQSDRRSLHWFDLASRDAVQCNTQKTWNTVHALVNRLTGGNLILWKPRTFLLRHNPTWVELRRNPTRSST